MLVRVGQRRAPAPDHVTEQVPVNTNFSHRTPSVPRAPHQHPTHQQRPRSHSQPAPASACHRARERVRLPEARLGKRRVTAPDHEVTEQVPVNTNFSHRTPSVPHTPQKHPTQQQHPRSHAQPATASASRRAGERVRLHEAHLGQRRDPAPDHEVTEQVQVNTNFSHRIPSVPHGIYISEQQCGDVCVRVCVCNNATPRASRSRTQAAHVNKRD